MNLTSTCPWCGKANNQASQVARPSEQDARPAPGDLIMCIGCGAFSVFTDNRVQRRPTMAEVAEMAHNPKCRAMRKVWRAMREARDGE